MICLRELEVIVPSWGVSKNWPDSLQGVNAQRPHGISLSVTAEVGGAFGTNPARCPWFSAWKGFKCFGLVAVGVYFRYWWRGGRSGAMAVCKLSLSHLSSQLSGDAPAQTPPGGGELNPVLEKKRFLPSFLWAPASCLFHQERRRPQAHGAGKWGRNKDYRKHDVK